jgi:O-antigen ligase
VTRELEGLSPDRVVALLERFVVLLIVPAVLLLLHVPGFQPEEPNLSPSSGSYLSYYTRLSHPILGRSNNLATVLVVFVPVLLWWGHTRRRRSATLVGVLGLVAVVATQSRGVVLAAVVALGIYALVRPRGRGRGRPVIGKVLLSTAVLAVAAVAFYELNPLTQELGASRLSLENVSLREALYGEAFKRLESRPWTGFGPGVVPAGDPALSVDVHNTYVQQLLSFGVPLGVVLAATLLALPVWFLVRARGVPAAGVVGLALTIELLSFAFEASFEGSVLRVIFYLSVGLLAGLVRRLEIDSGTAPAPTPRRSAPW